jgi:hypothetical protein
MLPASHSHEAVKERLKKQEGRSKRRESRGRSLEEAEIKRLKQDEENRQQQQKADEERRRVARELASHITSGRQKVDELAPDALRQSLVDISECLCEESTRADSTQERNKQLQKELVDLKKELQDMKDGVPKMSVKYVLNSSRKTLCSSLTGLAIYNFYNLIMFLGAKIFSRSRHRKTRPFQMAIPGPTWF